MLWARLLAYVTGTVNQELLLRNEYLTTENRILKGQIQGRLLLSEGEKATLAEIAHRLGRMALEDVAATAKPDTILGWYRKLIANKFDGSKFRRSVGAAGAKHDDGGVGMPERLPLSATRPRCEVLPMISRTDQDGKRESASIASKEPEFELVRRTLGEVGQRRMTGGPAEVLREGCGIKVDGTASLNKHIY
jgi:hypothetical protein